MREVLEQKYEKLFETYHFQRPIKTYSINAIIKNLLQDFLKTARKIAIYCNGGHTEMLMSDFIFELKEVRYIVDNYADISDRGGFHLIRDEEMEEVGIDGVIISSFKYKDSIAEWLKKNHPTIRYLNIYDKFAENGINLQSDYYYHNHPYHHYHTINSIQREIDNLAGKDELEQAYFSLIAKYIHIKDFLNAVKYAKKLYKITGTEITSQLITELENLCETEKAAAAQIVENNVLMLCMDGLRKQDLTDIYMPKLTEIFENSSFIFDNAYSFSTSTFESLIPVYSENGDLRTGYYKQNFIAEEDCRFLHEAKKQDRHIYFYTDMEHYIKGEGIRYSGEFQTITEKLWNFILDAVEEDNGLYYIHELYESHFSFSNPYTKAKLISEGTALLFDYLPQKGGKLRTDYEQQHLDALRYLDDVVSPLIQPMRCRMIVYADHGNLILKEDCRLKDVREAKLTCDDEWLHIAYVIRSPEMGTSRCNKLISLMSFNDIMISLLNHKTYVISEHTHIKAARSELYNPNFRYLYKEIGRERCLLAFETFIFMDGYKLLIFSDGIVELFLTATEQKIDDRELIWQFLQRIKEEITVCTLERVRIKKK